MKLEARIKRQFKAHVEKRQGAITAPDVLLDHILTEVERWLAEQKKKYSISSSFIRGEIVDEISSEIRKEAQ